LPDRALWADVKTEKEIEKKSSEGRREQREQQKNRLSDC